jgi:PadR family transcriptional regulator, regulatory protein PadR
MTARHVALLQGTLDLVILRTLEAGPMHGFGIARRIQTVTDDAFQVEEGSLYPALYRLEQRKWIRSSWGATENARRARYYRLTSTGRQQLASEQANWLAFAQAIAKILGPA